MRHEGHPDNVAAALYGGLVVVVEREGGLLVRRFDVPRTHVTVVIPAVAASTRQSRESLPDVVPLADAVYNIGRAALVVEALRSGDLDLLGRVMDDRLHQERRLRTIPGAAAALGAGREAGAGAVALSGSGPSLIAFAPSRAVGRGRRRGHGRRAASVRHGVPDARRHDDHPPGPRRGRPALGSAARGRVARRRVRDAAARPAVVPRPA